MPRAIHKDVNVFSHHVDNLSLFLVFDLPLAEVTSELEEPTLNFCLRKSEIVVHVHVVVAPAQNRQYAKCREEKEQTNCVSLAVLPRVLQVVYHVFEDDNGAECCDFNDAELKTIFNGAVTSHSNNLLLYSLFLDILHS